MAKKVGICKNIDCDNYNQEIEVASGAEFECPLCHQTLKEKAGGKKVNPGDKKLPLIIAVGVVVLGLVGGGIYWGLNRGKGDSNTDFIKDSTAVDIVVVDSAAVDTTVKRPEDTGKSGGKDESKGGVRKGTVNLPYGSYTGDLKNGKPHGYGTITYTVSHRIVPSKDFVANPGDTFEGEFRDGQISGIGYWKHDGNTTAIKL